ncbi:MAG TPA: response regulator [Candidatus Nitrosopolaris sp.]|nr:response regulator [Candidatus Nitrosopolaris sp.]
MKKENYGNVTGDMRNLLDKKKLRILVVDDEPDVNRSLREVFEQHGFKVDCYEDPLVALENFRSQLYDLVILDIKMPEMNGFSFYRKIKKLDKKITVCFLTAGEMYYGVYSDIFTSLPANCFIRKPIGNDELLKRIHEITKISDVSESN